MDRDGLRLGARHGSRSSGTMPEAEWLADGCALRFVGQCDAWRRASTFIRCRRGWKYPVVDGGRRLRDGATRVLHDANARRSREGEAARHTAVY